MSVLLRADLEGGTLGSTIATTDAGSPNAWQDVKTVAGGTCAYDATHVAHGSKAAKFATGATVGNSMLKWNTALTGGAAGPGPFRLRAYLYMTSNAAQIVPISFMNGTFTNRVGVRITTAGKMAVLVNGTGTVDKTSLATLPLNQWVRLELAALCAAAGGWYELRYFSSLDSNVVDETLKSSGISTGGDADSVAFGVTQQVANAPAFWMDDLAATDGDWIGPAGAHPELITAGFFGA